MTVLEQNHDRDLGVSLDSYAGQWVALLNDEIVLSAPTLGELLEQIESQDAFADAEVLQVPREKAAACFF
jgi:Family of unknown function (DUF5678)